MGREERRKYEADVAYEVWRRGGDMDRINDLAVEDEYYDGMYPEDSAGREMKRQAPTQPAEGLKT